MIRRLSFSKPKNPVVVMAIIGGIGVVILNGTIFGYLAIKNSKKNPSGQVAGQTTETSPLPTLKPTAEPTATLIASPTPTATTTPKPSPTPTVTPKPTTTPSPTPPPTGGPTPYPKEDIRINSPENQRTYDSNNIDIKMQVLANSDVEKLEVILNGSSKHTFTGQVGSYIYTYTTKLDKGVYLLKGKATLKNGNTIESGIVQFGTGNQPWNSPTPTPTPTPSPTVSPTPTVTPTGVSTPTPTP